MPRPDPTIRFVGLNTSSPADGMPPEEATVCQGFRVGSGDLSVQPGMVVLDQAGATLKAGDLTAASSEYYVVESPLAAWTLRRNWTFRQIIQPDTVTGTQYVVGWAHAANWPFTIYLDGATLTVVHKDTNPSTVTLTSSSSLSADAVYGIELVRSGTTLSLYVNGALEDSDTVASLDTQVPTVDLYFGRSSAGNYFDGTLEGPELIVRSDLPTTRSLCRYPDPKGEIVRCWYDFDADSNAICKDLSRWGNHAKALNTPTEATSLARVLAPGHAVATYTTESGSPKVVIGAGGLVYIREAF